MSKTSNIYVLLEHKQNNWHFARVKLWYNIQTSMLYHV